MDNVYAQRIEMLRTLMRSKGWDAVIITGSDPHNSEFPALRWKQVEWISGFTGEAGDIVVTLDHAGLWTDSRYFIQAAKQLDGSGITLHKTRVPEQVLIPEWLAGQAADYPEYIVAVDGLCISASFASELNGLTLVSVPDMLDIFWKDRPAAPQTPVFRIDPGENSESKLRWLREVMAENNCRSILVNSLDEIAWLLNVRASDIDYTPVVISNLLVTGSDALWFVLKEDVEDPVTDGSFAELQDEGIRILPYSGLTEWIEENSDLLGRLWVDNSSLNFELDGLLCRKGVERFTEASPVILRKAVKNETEIDNIREAHLQDGIVMEKFLFWLETSLKNGDCITEWNAAVKLGQLRASIEDYRGDSFETISAFGEGAALPHYITPKINAPTISGNGLYLCDSGGQYLRGTTDITRTIPIGECSPLEKEDYTLVLKGHIQLAMAVFPAGTAGCQIDALSREPLWKHKRNFGHGTGHGVGYYLGCHEGPQDVRQNFNSTPLLPGMVISDEPGIYREGMHGVRHENLLLVVEAGRNDFGRWLEFETLTLCHFDTSAIVADLLSDDEKAWLNAYNEKVYRTLARYLENPERDWLRSKTEAI